MLKTANDIEIAEHAGAASEEAGADDDERIDLRAFIRRNKNFFIMNMGIAALLFSNGILSNYMPQIAAGAVVVFFSIGKVKSHR